MTTSLPREMLFISEHASIKAFKRKERQWKRSFETSKSWQSTSNSEHRELSKSETEFSLAFLANQAQFKRRTFHVPNLIHIWVDPNNKVRRLIQTSNFTCAEPNSWSKQISYLSLKTRSKLTKVICNNSDAFYFDLI